MCPSLRNAELNALKNVIKTLFVSPALLQISLRLDSFSDRIQLSESAI